LHFDATKKNKYAWILGIRAAAARPGTKAEAVKNKKK
jgi:hypothetical protein